MYLRGWFQLAVRDAELSEQLRRVLVLYSTARLSRDTRGGFPELGEPSRFAGVLAEYGPGFEAWITSLRRHAPSLPVLVVIERFDAYLFNALHAQSIEIAVRPLHPPQIVAFVQRALASNFLPDERVARMVAHLAQVRGLTAREVQLLSYCLGDVPRARVRRRLGISENTLKTQIRSLLRKCGERNVDALAKNLLRAALLRARGSVSQLPVAPWCSAPELLSGAA